MIHLALEHPEGGYAARVVRLKAREFLDRLGLPEAELTVVITTDARIRRLKRRWFGVDEATDVLSFPAGEPMPNEERALGDVVISLDTARRRAAQDGRSLAFELSRYLAHGILHLMGLDHERSPREARKMARLEARLLGLPGMLADTRGIAEGAPASRGARKPVERPPRRRDR